jgi:hypothetical protein
MDQHFGEKMMHFGDKAGDHVRAGSVKRSSKRGKQEPGQLDHCEPGGECEL